MTYVTYSLLLIIVVLSPCLEEAKGVQTQIPSWVKNVAGWWSERQVDDKDFVKGIQFLIQQQIIKIPKTESKYTQTQIPSWIRNTSGWWANGTISDSDFVKGIQYMVQTNVITVNLPSIFKLSSPAFQTNGTIPSMYTCDGINISPPLTISGIPENTVSMAMVLYDVDAPIRPFTHWVVWNIPANLTDVSEGSGGTFTQGTNSLGKIGYFGPCPPNGIHHYFFKLYSLDYYPSLESSTTRTNLENVIKDHIIDVATLEATYSR